MDQLVIEKLGHIFNNSFQMIGKNFSSRVEHLLEAQVFIVALLANWAPLVIMPSFDYVLIVPLAPWFK